MRRTMSPLFHVAMLAALAHGAAVRRTDDDTFTATGDLPPEDCGPVVIRQHPLTARERRIEQAKMRGKPQTKVPNERQLAAEAKRSRRAAKRLSR